MANVMSQLVPAGIFFVVLTVVISVGGQILGQVEETQCSADSTFANYNNAYQLTMGDHGADPVSGSTEGCCSQINSSNATICDQWNTSTEHRNITFQGVTAMSNFGQWFVVLVVIVVASVIIALVARFGVGGV